MRHHVPIASTPTFEGSSSPHEWLDLARTWSREGRHADALRAHRWYHAHALQADDAQHGVRLSFALSSWADLSHVYPPARTALLTARKRAARRGLGPPLDSIMIGEALAIDWALGDDDASYRLIVEVEERHPADIQDCFQHRVLDVLAARADWHRCLRWMGDPVHRLDMALGAYVFDGGPFGRSRFGARSRVIDDIYQLVEVLVGAGRTRTASKLVREARQIVNDPRLDGMVEAARQRHRTKRRRPDS